MDYEYGDDDSIIINLSDALPEDYPAAYLDDDAVPVPDKRFSEVEYESYDPAGSNLLSGVVKTLQNAEQKLLDLEGQALAQLNARFSSGMKDDGDQEVDIIIDEGDEMSDPTVTRIEYDLDDDVDDDDDLVYDIENDDNSDSIDSVYYDDEDLEPDVILDDLTKLEAEDEAQAMINQDLLRLAQDNPGLGLWRADFGLEDQDLVDDYSEDEDGEDDDSEEGDENDTDDIYEDDDKDGVDLTISEYDRTPSGDILVDENEYQGRLKYGDLLQLERKIEKNVGDMLSDKTVSQNWQDSGSLSPLSVVFIVLMTLVSICVMISGAFICQRKYSKIREDSDFKKKYDKLVRIAEGKFMKSSKNDDILDESQGLLTHNDPEANGRSSRASSNNSVGSSSLPESSAASPRASISLEKKSELLV